MTYLLWVLCFLLYVCCAVVVLELISSIFCFITKIKHPVSRRLTAIFLVVFAPVSILITMLISIVCFVLIIVTESYKSIKRIW